MTRPEVVSDTKSIYYSDRLTGIAQRRWKRIVAPLNPYKFHVRLISVSNVLDVGCGIGRNLDYLVNSDAIGIDHNIQSVEIARQRGFTAFTDTEFLELNHKFNTILFSHVLEHMNPEEAIGIVSKYLGCLNPGGRLIIICPQIKGQKSDPSHVYFCDFQFLEQLVESQNLEIVMSYSFPLPNFFGRWFVYNESVVIAKKPLISGT